MKNRDCIFMANIMEEVTANGVVLTKCRHSKKVQRENAHGPLVEKVISVDG